MSSTRFGVLLGLAAVVVAGGAFVLGLQVLDDDDPDPAPAGAVDATDDGAEPADGGEGTGSTSTSEPAEVTEGALPSPSWILVISSEGDEARARAVADEVAAAGHPAGVLRSDDHPSLNPGFWVAYAGPYPDAAAAAAAEPAVEADGWPGAYVRCAGAEADCGGGGDDDDGDDGGD